MITMERREERFEKCRKPVSVCFESRRGAMQTCAAAICLFELVTENSITFERAIHQVTLCMFQRFSGSELFAVDRYFSAHPIGRQRSARSVDEDETGDLAVG